MGDKYSKGQLIFGMIGNAFAMLVGLVIFIMILTVGGMNYDGFLIMLGLSLFLAICGFIGMRKCYKEAFGKNAQNNVPPSTPQPQPVQPQQTPQPQPVVPKDTHVPTPAPVQQTADENDDDEDAEKRQVLQTAFTHLIKMRGAEVLKTPPVTKSIMADLTFNKHKDTVTAFYTMLEEMNNGKSFSDKQSVKRIMKFLENAFKENGTAVPEILRKAKNENGL